MQRRFAALTGAAHVDDTVTTIMKGTWELATCAADVA